MKAAVTGAAGFVGRHLIERLQKDGHQAVGTDLPGTGIESLGCEAHGADLCTGHGLDDCFKGAEVVFHVAAFASPWGPRERYMAVNLKGTENVLAACKRQGVRRLVHVSSTAAVFDGWTHHDFTDETFPYPEKFLSPYGESKSKAEKLVLGADGDEIETTAVRPHLIWGPRDRIFFSRLHQQAKNGPIYHVGGGRTMTDTTYVENLIHGMMLAAASDKARGKAYYITNGEPLRYSEFIDRFLEVLELPRARGGIPISLAYFAGAALEAVWAVAGIKREPVVTRYKVAELACNHTYKLDRAKSDLGYEPPVSTDEGFRRFKTWWEAEGKSCYA